MVTNGKTKINFSQTVSINGIKTYISIRLGIIIVRGKIIEGIIADKVNKKWIYYNPISETIIKKYHHKTPKKLVEALELELIENATK
jgi:hypothetical protein